MPIWDSGVVVATEIVVAPPRFALLTAAAVPVAVLTRIAVFAAALLAIVAAALTLLLLSTLFSLAGFVLTFVGER